MTDTAATGADWHDIPAGFYAIPRLDDEGQLIGYDQYQRKVPRTSKNGRTVGRHGLRAKYVSAKWMQLVVTPNVSEWTPPAMPSQKMLDTVSGHTGGNDQSGYRSNILLMLEEPELCRETFGRLTGRCGCCGRKLTDPDSKMRGIGPECIKGQR